MSEAQNEIEQATLACMASSSRVATRIVEVVQSQDFTRYEHQVVFATMRDMLAEGTRIDELTLPAELRKDGHGDAECAVANQLWTVASRLASVDHGVEYAEVVREESIRRDLTHQADVSLGRGGDIEEVVAGLEAAVFSARSRMQGEGAVSIYTGASILSPLDAFLSGSESRDGFPYPFPTMRENWGLFERGMYCILSGYSGDGKTTVATQWIEDALDAGAKVCVYQQEMTGLGVSRLLATQGAGLTPRQAKGLDTPTMEDLERYEQRRKKIVGWGDRLTVRTGQTSPTQIRGDQARERYDVILVDHMQKFERTRDGEYADITRYSSQLHRITRDLNCSVICLSQLKTPQDGSRPMPTPAMLRGTRSMEEDADSVLFVWRERSGGGARSNSSMFIVGKMRDGETDKAFPIVLDTDRVRFFETDDKPAGPSVLARRRGVA